MNAGVNSLRTVYVCTPARLHLGIFNLPAGGYGGIGVAVALPNVELTATPANEVIATGLQAERVLAAARRFLAYHGLHTGVHVQVHSAIPPHAGLGSGTQLELAVGCAMARLHRLPAAPEFLARVAGRASRSMIGLEAFRQGGFVVHAALNGAHPRTWTLPFPSDWVFVIALPAGAQGLSGRTEEQAFQELAPMNPGMIRSIHDRVGGELLPALTGRDIRRFGRALTAIQEQVGDYFAGHQGGRYSHPLSPALADTMLAAGACGVAQSSWGPALCALAPAGAAAERVRQAAAAFLPGPGAGEVLIASPANSGAVWRWVACA